MVDKQVIEEIKNNANIVEVIGDVISLQKAGRNYLGLCPFHGEKHLFQRCRGQAVYHCFGCGRSGDVFKFIEEYQGVTFMEAVQILGQRVGIEVENRFIVNRSQPRLTKLFMICTKMRLNFTMLFS